MAAETERWELEIELPPVNEDVRTVLIWCGYTAVTVERDNNGWAATQGAAVTKRQPDRDSAISDARTWVQRMERIRLLRNMAEPAVRHAEAQAEATGAGEPGE